MSLQAAVFLTFGGGFLALLLVIGCWLVILQKPIPDVAQLIFRAVLAVAAAGATAVLPGMLNLNLGRGSNYISATGALAVFVVIYLINPPSRLAKSLNSPKEPILMERPPPPDI